MAVCTGANILHGDKEPLQATDSFFQMSTSKFHFQTAQNKMEFL